MNIELLLFGVIIAVFLIDFLKKGMKKRNDSNELTKVEDNEEPVKYEKTFLNEKLHSKQAYL
jgi:predicted membrane protein